MHTVAAGLKFPYTHILGLRFHEVRSHGHGKSRSVFVILKGRRYGIVKQLLRSERYETRKEALEEILLKLHRL
jgi:hypothetical protein